MAPQLNLYKCEIIKHPTRVRRNGEDSKQFAVTVKVHGQVDRESLKPGPDGRPQEPKVAIWSNAPLVSFFLGENSRIWQSGACKGTTLYIPAAMITDAAARRGDGQDVKAGDGTPIRRFHGLDVGGILVKDAPAAFTGEVKVVTKSTFLASDVQTATRPSFLQMAKQKLLGRS